MIVFISGGSGSGKSAFAENVAVRLGGKKIYVATMPVFSEEDQKKVERHHRLRAGKGFTTMERPKALEGLPDGGETVLIECMSTHTANFLFDPELAHPLLKEAETKKEIIIHDSLVRIREELDPILIRKGNTIFVSAETGFDGRSYEPETEIYQRVLAGVNQYLAEHADAVFEVVCGIPVCVKGDHLC